MVIACDLFETPASFKLDPSDTTWALVKIDGREIAPGGGAVMIVVGLDDVVFETRCRTITAGLVLDTDGSGWGVVDPVWDPSTCTEEEAAVEQRSVDAFLATEEWAVLSDTEIELRGPTSSLCRDSERTDRSCVFGVRTGAMAPSHRS